VSERQAMRRLTNRVEAQAMLLPVLKVSNVCVLVGKHSLAYSASEPPRPLPRIRLCVRPGLQAWIWGRFLYFSTTQSVPRFIQPTVSKPSSLPLNPRPQQRQSLPAPKPYTPTVSKPSSLPKSVSPWAVNSSSHGCQIGLQSHFLPDALLPPF
jgi:hypothetical protein